ncbi:cysteine dioxygenase [Streptomyces sp. NPDC021020]|uniref:cysteine dioxygenase n=1 Tax=Streptomyces sp. NPDC021020 TaxID=3365109 RepID=UPI0037A68613
MYAAHPAHLPSEHPARTALPAPSGAADAYGAYGPAVSDVAIAGDPLALPHLLPPVPQHPATVADFAGLARAVAADRAQWEPLVRYDATTRWYARLRTGPGYEVWLLSWLPGQGSGLHDHGPSSGVLTVLAGSLRESARGATGAAVRVLGAGAQRAFAPGYVHEVVNDSLEPAVSLHVYFPGLTEMTPQRCNSPAAAAVPQPAR